MAALGAFSMQLAVQTCRAAAPRRRSQAGFGSQSGYMGSRLALPRLAGARLAPRRAAAAPVRAAFFGVGAPEAVLVGVVALLVFGPKGLAQAAKSLGQTLRAFQPTIRELTQVSAELKSTLEQEIGLDEIKSELSKPAVPPPRPVPTAEAPAGPLEGRAAAPEVDPDIEAKRAAAAAAAWAGSAPAAQPAAGGSLDAMSTDALEAELQRRRAAAQGGGSGSGAGGE